MNSLCIFTPKRARVLCIYRLNKVCLELLSYLRSVSHIINILLGLYGENILAHQVLAVGTELLPRTQLIETMQHKWQLYITATK